ncbi:MAG: RluA family pseudouridine synthase [Candidatus Eisenbacteria bacterium]|nr:RluA family pseudouridine synthase [Candidatus Eisenbacteria bacterium]
MKTCHVSAEQAGRIDLVVAALTGLSRTWIKGLFDHDCVTRNGRPAPNPGERVEVGDAVEVCFDPHTRYREKPRVRVDPAFQVLYEDEHIIVVEKAAFVLTVPTQDGETDTLVQRVGRYLGRGGPEHRVTVVQRLDHGTSGVMVFAITEAAATELIDQFKRHAPAREYVALVSGLVKEDRGTIESRLATNRRLSRYSTHGEDGERAVTHFEVEERFQDVTRVRVKLETGRRNQIRVHFAEAGHPVLGDTRYRPELARHPRWRSRRQALHAAVLGFTHPVSRQRMRFESPLPPEFGAFTGGEKKRGAK